MQRTEGAGHIDNRFVQEDVAANRPPTEVTAAFMNAVQEELVALATGAGDALDPTKNDQALAAVKKLIGRALGNFQKGVVLNADTTLTAADAGTAYSLDGGCNSVTLPGHSAGQGGGAFLFCGGRRSTAFRIKAKGDDTLFFNNGQPSSILLGPNDWALIASNGAQFQVFEKSGGQFRGSYQTGSRTLSLADAGNVHQIVQQNATITLPDTAGAAELGIVFTLFSNVSSWTLVAPSGKALTCGSIVKQSLVIPQGAEAKIVTDGGDGWFVLGTAANALLPNFSSSLGANGYKRYPDPNSPTGFMIEQWGELFLATGNGDAVAFLIAFPNSVMGIWAVDCGNGCNNVSAVRNGGNLTNFLAYGKSPGTNTYVGTAYRWYAIGY